MLLVLSVAFTAFIQDAPAPASQQCGMLGLETDQEICEGAEPPLEGADSLTEERRYGFLVGDEAQAYGCELLRSVRDDLNREEERARTRIEAGLAVPEDEAVAETAFWRSFYLNGALGSLCEP